MALVNVQRQQEHPNYAVAGKRQEARIYRCPNCKGWHLTGPRPEPGWRLTDDSTSR